VILGGGYIAAEFASILHGLGVNTTLIYRGKQILKIFDNEINSFLQNQMKKKGIKFVLEKDIEDISQLGKDQFEVLFTDKSTFKTELVLSALGRLPNIDGLNLSAIKIDLNSNNSIKVDKYSKTNLDNIFAIGDVTDRVNLTPLAIREGHAFSDSEFGNNKRYLNYSLIPTAVFTDPPLATVGLSEKEAIKRKINIKKYITSFTPMKYSLTEIDSKILMKLIVEKETDKVLGIHMVGMDSPEIIQSLAVSLTAGVTKRQFDQTIAMHPTTAEEFVTL
jgi:glutathione reductase (NADPH)